MRFGAYCLPIASAAFLIAAAPQVAAVELAFLKDVSLWHSEVNLHEDPTRYNGRYIDGVVIGNGSLLAVEGMTTEINRFNKSRLTDSKLHGLERFESSFNGFAEHLSRSRRVPLHYLQWVSGPLYTEYPVAHGFEFSMDYAFREKVRSIDARAWNHEAQYRIRNTAIIKNVLSAEDVTVTSIDFMLSDKPVFIRNITVANKGSEDLKRGRFLISFYVDPRNWTGPIEPPSAQRPQPKAAPPNELEFHAKHVTRSPRVNGRTITNAVMIETPLGDAPSTNAKKIMLVHAPQTFARVDKQFVEFEIGTLKQGETRTFDVFIIAGFDETGLGKTLDDIQGVAAEKLLAGTYDYWKAKIDAADKLALPLRKDLEPRVKDYLDNLRLFLLALHTQAGPSVAHPYSYNWLYLRDGYDVFRAMLALGHQEECRHTILFFKEAMHRFGIEMAYSPTEFHLAAQRSESKIDQSPAPQGFAKSEYMLFFPLMVRDYEEKFGDEALTKSVYAEMQKAFAAQPVVGDGLIAYSGDEISVKRGAPKYRYSPQNAAMYVADAKFLEIVALKLGLKEDAADFKRRGNTVAEALEKRFWLKQGFYAYSAGPNGELDERPNVFCQALPFFYGYNQPADPRLNAMTATILKSNTFPSYRVSTLPMAGRRKCPNNGNSIGLLLYLMSLGNHPDAAKVFDRMLADAGTMGTTGEYLFVTNDSITRGEMLRGHESAFNLCAALEHLKANTQTPIDKNSN